MHKFLNQTALLALLAGIAAGAGAAEKKCPAGNAIINDSNNLIMLDGTAKGDIRQVVAGMVGKDLDEQARSSILFDTCSRLAVEAYDYHKKERNITLMMSNHTQKADYGWVSEYDIVVSLNKDGKQTILNHKEGITRFFVGKHGVITSSTDAFTLNNRPGFTTIIYDYDKALRLTKSTARGSDALTNNEYVFSYDQRGNFSGLSSSHGKATYKYGPDGREAGSFSTSKTSVSIITKVEECRRNDDKGNCILSYGRDTEIFGNDIIRRHRSTATQYQYWTDENKS